MTTSSAAYRHPAINALSAIGITPFVCLTHPSFLLLGVDGVAGRFTAVCEHEDERLLFTVSFPLFVPRPQRPAAEVLLAHYNQAPHGGVFTLCQESGRIDFFRVFPLTEGSAPEVAALSDTLALAFAAIDVALLPLSRIAGEHPDDAPGDARSQSRWSSRN